MKLRLVACAVAAALLPLSVAAPASARVTTTLADVDYVVDGDTLRLDNGKYVRLVGIDTPEVGECGYKAAKRRLDRMVGDRVNLGNPGSVKDKDRYGRLLRYVGASGRDTGTVLLKVGLAKARYDGLDGYQWHPRQARYHRLDAAHADHRCR